ncbi:hypothetical protein CAXC1_180065 [Candidatus Xenohaliotis californiensis]|uniref:Uncharacterized protein n=1 Tax=Candidatus Xenohaliotis californiensis TaxID=84677 RepID=A0ABM9N7G7_9RICK|nr:hypothetical protein CAXC1_180065 [Candidatus Xenohaliotis californiensis]
MIDSFSDSNRGRFRLFNYADCLFFENYGVRYDLQ